MSQDKEKLLDGADIGTADSGWYHVGNLEEGSVTIEVEGLAAGDGVTIYGTNRPDPASGDQGQAIGSEQTDSGFLVGISPHPEYVRVEGTTDGGNGSTLNAWLRGWREGT